MKINKQYKKLFLIISFIIISYVIYIALSIYFYGENNKIIKSDAAIVLGAAVWGEEPSPVFKERINHGIWLYKNGYVDKIIFTGGLGEKEKISEAIVAKKYAMKKNISSEDILVETKSKITEENLYYAKEVATKNNLNTFIVVSDPLHMKRAMLMAKDYELEACPSPTPTTRYRSLKSKGSFLVREVYYYIGYQIYRVFAI